MSTIQYPTAYAENRQKGLSYDKDVAERYLQHTVIGDDALDPVLAELSDLRSVDLHRFVAAGIESNEKELSEAPQILRDFFSDIEHPPAWHDNDSCSVGIRAFHANTQYILAAFVTGVLIEGFTTLIAKSFNTTGRVIRGPGDRRLRQNNRHLMEIFIPGGLQRYGDGWKLSVRIRFIHAQVRRLLTESDAWSIDIHGTPISAAHVGFATAVFSMRLLQHATSLGASFTEDEQASFMRVWRYAGYLMGVPESFLFEDYDYAERIFKVGLICEPDPDKDNIAMANALVQSVPLVAGIKDAKEQDKIKSLVYRLSRALIGDVLADQLEFPKSSRNFTLLFYRTKEQLKRYFKSAGAVKSQDFMQLIDVSEYEQRGISYNMPDSLYTENSSDW